MNLNKLMNLRKENGWSLQYVSSQLGVAKSTYAGYESGYRRPSLEALISMADLFDTSVDYILGRVDDPVSHSAHKEKAIELSRFPDVALSIDENILSESEMQLFVAFIRAKREIEQTVQQEKENQKKSSS